jgi:hypothetical protein
VVLGGALGQGLLARGGERSEEPLFFDTKVRSELPGEALARRLPGLRQRRGIPRVAPRALHAARQHERRVVIVRQRLEVRMALHAQPSFPSTRGVVRIRQ